MPRQQIVLIWGAALILLQAYTDGDIAALWSEVTAGTGSRPAGLFGRLAGEAVFLFLLWLVASFGDDEANLSLVLLGGLSLLYLVNNQATIGSLISTLQGGGGSSSPGTGSGPTKGVLHPRGVPHAIAKKGIAHVG